MSSGSLVLFAMFLSLDLVMMAFLSVFDICALLLALRILVFIGAYLSKTFENIVSIFKLYFSGAC